ncbi:hypothetical protein HAX54_022460 [Datura stramonium]|uniref:Uncharacterized protein n=1 Tax=Datura stramonium TaxID=4076 RepID=A0ABS8UUL4_DATST|nr:hypothetical protein [Datura stramonium]
MWQKLEGERGVSNSRAGYGERKIQQRTDIRNSNSTGPFLLYDQGTVGSNASSEGANEACNGHVTSQSQIVLENESDDNRSILSDQSSDLGEIERERVRQVFQEWMSTGVKDHSQSLSVSHKNNCSGAPWLGENERERVRIIREWVQINIQQSGAGSPRDEGAADIGYQFEQVRDGFLVNHSENGEIKPVRIYCGKKTLLDLLMKFQLERKREIQGLLECKPVSNFTYRNRIQTLLKGRFLRNERLMTSDERTTSDATSELGLLRQNHTVSDLRKEILSRLVNNARGSAKDIQLNTSSKDDLNHHRSEQSQSNNEQEIIDESYDQSALDNKERETDGSHGGGNSESVTSKHVNQQNSVHQIAEHSDQIRGKEDIEQETLIFEFIFDAPERENNDTRHLMENGATEWLQETASVESGSRGRVSEDHEPFHDNDAPRSEASDTHEVYGHSHCLIRNTFEDYEWQLLIAQAQESQDMLRDHEESNLQQSEEPDELVIEHGESEQLPASEHNEMTNDTTEDMGGSWQEDAAQLWSPENLEYDTEEQIYEQEQHEDWQSNALEGANDDWLDLPSGQNAESMRRVDSFYMPDDDSVYNIELQELLSRRRVSNLLQSGFRQSLDRLIQSYVERQGHASDWYMDGTSSSPGDTENELLQEYANQDWPQINSESNHFSMTSRHVPPSQPLWDLDLDDQNLPLQDPWQCIGTDWEIIHELRNDMARLQQRMDNMQRMLQKCMEMQVELQRAVHQDVSAALNPYACSTDIGACEDSPLTDESKWDKVRKGICCLCCNSSIDALLYR